MTTTTSPVDNGVDVRALLDARAALVDNPDAAQFTWKATTTWVNGTHTESTIEDYHGLGADHRHRSTFSFTADHPEVFAAARFG